jgi:hypothetical protein
MKEIAEAIAGRFVVSFEYDGKYREVEPHIVGASQTGKALMRGYQVGGDSNGPLPQWRLFDLTKVVNIQFVMDQGVPRVFKPRLTQGFKYNDGTFTMVAATVSKIRVFYALQDLTTAKSDPCIMLLGPTPRAKNVLSWRPEALHILSDLGFSGNVLVPESHDWLAHDNYDNQIDWEWEAFDIPGVVRAFWIPREHDTMPGYTTNIEFGMAMRDYHHGDADAPTAVLGFPETAIKMRYLKRLAERYQVPVINDLREMLTEAIKLAQKD